MGVAGFPPPIALSRAGGPPLISPLVSVTDIVHNVGDRRCWPELHFHSFWRALKNPVGPAASVRRLVHAEASDTH